mgnify:CR=1 FL=1
MPRMTHSVLFAATLALALPCTAAPPANDACPAATSIPGLELPFTRTLDTTQATSDGDPAVACTSPAPGKSVWFTFRPETSETYAFDASGSTPFDYAPVLALYTGSCGGLVPVANGCARSRLAAPLVAGTTYYLLVAGEAVLVDPSIRISLDGVDLCPGGPGPGGGSCGTTFDVRVGDQLAGRAYNEFTNALLTTGTFTWSLGANADPATATGPSTSFKYSAPVASTEVVLTWTPPGQAPISRQVTMRVAAALPPASLDGPGSFPALAAGETATIPSPGGQLRLSVQRDTPEWRQSYVVPSVANVVNAAGIPFVSDFSVANLEPIETVVGLELSEARLHPVLSGRWEEDAIILEPGYRGAFLCMVALPLFHEVLVLAGQFQRPLVVPRQPLLEADGDLEFTVGLAGVQDVLKFLFLDQLPGVHALIIVQPRALVKPAAPEPAQRSRTAASASSGSNAPKTACFARSASGRVPGPGAASAIPPADPAITRPAPAIP